MVTVKQRGLGKGLSALLGDADNSYEMAKSASATTLEVVSSVGEGQRELPINKLVPGKYQPRHRFNEAALKELSESIARNGIMQPIIVRASREIPDRFEIIAGERRWRAAKLANLNHVPVLVRDISDQQALEMALVENVQRQDLTPLEEAFGYDRLMLEFNYTQDELAGIVGKSRSHVTNMLRLLGLSQAIKDLLEEGKLSMGHARALLTMPNAEHWAHEAVKHGWSVRQIETKARAEIGTTFPEKAKRVRKAPDMAVQSREKDPDVVALEFSLGEKLGADVEIQSHGEKGAIVLRYVTLEQLDIILSRLNA